MGGRGSNSEISGGYHTFGGKASGEYQYSGSDKNVVAFFDKNSNYNELIEEATPEQISALHSWSSGVMMGGAQYFGWDSMTDYGKKMTQNMDDYLDKSTLDESIVVTRLSDTQLVLGFGNKKGTLAELQSAEGSIIVSKGSMSCAAASEGLSIGSHVGTKSDGYSVKNIEYKIHIPGGSQSNGVGSWIGDSRINDWGSTQREFITNRDTAYRVGKSVYNSKRDIYVTDIYYVGLMEHDYGTTGRI